VICADPEAWYCAAMAADMDEEARTDLRAALRNPAVVHGMCEDYRAGLTIDADHDRADRAAGRRVRCPVQVLWATRDDPDLFGIEPTELWHGWADDLRGEGIDSGHHVAEEAPDATASALDAFWEEIGWRQAPASSRSSWPSSSADAPAAAATRSVAR
jgi:haloacetate dehalogenase